MRQFKYVGPYEEVEVNHVGLVKQGEVVKVDGEVADGLDGQDIWEHIPDPERSKAAKKAAEKRSDDSTDSQEG